MIKVVDYFGLDNELSTIETAAKVLGIDDVEITVIKNDKMLNQVGSKDYVVNGLLYKNKMPGNSYNLYIRKDTNTPLRSIICHEMLHLQQYINGDLSVDTDKRIFIWKGKIYSYNFPYMERPWEQEVYKKQDKLISDLKKAYPKECLLTKLFKR
jgi:hypothetical protein